MPFIRYEVGDVVTAPREEPCPCGCAFPRIDVLQGRADDWLYSADGERVSPLIFVIASIPGVQRVQSGDPEKRRKARPRSHGAGHADRRQAGRAHSAAIRQNAAGHLRDFIPQQSGKMRRVISEIEK